MSVVHPPFFPLSGVGGQCVYIFEMLSILSPVFAYVMRKTWSDIMFRGRWVGVGVLICMCMRVCLHVCRIHNIFENALFQKWITSCKMIIV